ncbi:tetratricopeptide repeat protein [Deinococcus yavapaiensis]|uniref:Tetratricopeptide repeat protein n=1 Tax=Deinococcus yavapaiensis KR-236 TaxID=694435 RepID=A0A318S1Q5_9DEIO|nr:tetratricopeptide repeat protein [Deinococcus yavapaiensis]PYE50414.1 tetratricopeptide repeat protein [Deinococcus yavapaiensis KR-236]
MKRFTLTLLALTSSSLAASPPDLSWQAHSDARALPSEAALQQQLQRERARLCDAPRFDASKLTSDQLGAYQNMERLLAMLGPSSESRATFEQTFAKMTEAYAKTAPLTPPKVPATLAEALKDAAAWLEKRESAGLKAFSSSPDAKDAALASRAAESAALLGKPNAALAALLAAHRLQPQEPQHLVNLGGVLVTLGLPGDALTVLDAAAKLQQNTTGPLGWSNPAVLSTNRGLALTALRRFDQAETVLRRAIAAEPMLSEANAGLSVALTCQGKFAEAAKFARAGARRTPPKTTAQTQPQTPQEIEVTTGSADVLTRLPAAFTFDLSHGKEASLPNLKLPQTPAEAVALRSRYEKLQDELDDRATSLRNRMDELDMQLRDRKESAFTRARRNALWDAMLSIDQEPHMRALVEAKRKTQYDAPRLQQDFYNCEGGCVVDEISRRVRSQEEFLALCVPALESQNNKWRGAMHGHAENLGAYFKQGYKLLTGLAANASDPILHERASLYAELWATSLYSGYVGTAYGWASALTPHYQEWCLKSSASAAPVVANELVLPKADGCKDLLGASTFGFSLPLLSFKVSCESLSMTTASPGWLGAFGQLNHTFGTEDYTVTVGVQESIEAGSIVGIESKQGVYITWGADGITDAGAVVKTSVKVVVKGGGDSKASPGSEIKALSGKWSFIAKSSR